MPHFDQPDAEVLHAPSKTRDKREQVRDALSVDIFADSIARLVPEVLAVCLVELGAPWGARAERSRVMIFQFVRRGSAELETTRGTMLLEQGDLVLHTRGDPHVIRDRPRSALRPMSEFFGEGQPDQLAKRVRVGDGKHTTLLCGAIGLGGSAGNIRSSPLMAAIPSVLRIRADETGGGASIEGTVEQLVAECQTPGLGSSLIVQHLAHVLLTQALRSHAVSSQGIGKEQWLAALVDTRLRPALEALHAAPEAPWTVAALARRASMSRSSFAHYFRRVAGVTPMAWLTEQRMQRAAQLLVRDETLTLDAVATAVGYGSGPALHAAFVRWSGLTPNAYRRQPRALSLPNNARTSSSGPPPEKSSGRR